MTTKLVLFDFDGTLVDSAPDLAFSANYLRQLQALPPLELATLRPYATKGARGLIKAALNMDMDHPDFEKQRDIFLTHYAKNSTTHSRLFDGVNQLLQDLQHQDIAWGVVTNKAVHLTQPILDHFNLSAQCLVLVGGDSTPYLKPNPASLLLACEKTNTNPSNCIYIGDDERDIIAGKAAGMATMVAAYGYCDFDPAITSWNADSIANHAAEIMPLIQRWLG